jgi:hypothetical protein
MSAVLPAKVIVQAHLYPGPDEKKRSNKGRCAGFDRLPIGYQGQDCGRIEEECRRQA